MIEATGDKATSVSGVRPEREVGMQPAGKPLSFYV
jgi:hypothetical protein